MEKQKVVVITKENALEVMDSLIDWAHVNDKGKVSHRDHVNMTHL